MCDESMKSVRPALIWMDRRAEKERRMVEETIGRERIFQTTGNGTDSYFGYTKLLWVKENEPENWEKIRHILPIHSYILYKMTGKLTVDYCSAGNVGGIYDYSTHSWSKDMCREMGIPYEALPKDFHSPSDIIGTVTPEYQKKLGLSSPVPMCAGTVDCIASMLSAGIVRPGDNAAVLGTSLNWGYIHDRRPDNPDLVSMPYCIEPSRFSYTYGGSSTAGALPRWFANQFMGDDTSRTYDELEQMILSQNIGPGSDGLVALPYFMGERTPIWDEKASRCPFWTYFISHERAHLPGSSRVCCLFSPSHHGVHDRLRPCHRKNCTGRRRRPFLDLETNLCRCNRSSNLDAGAGDRGPAGRCFFSRGRRRIYHRLQPDGRMAHYEPRYSSFRQSPRTV